MPKDRKTPEKDRKKDPGHMAEERLPTPEEIKRLSAEMRGYAALEVIKREVTRLDRILVQNLTWNSAQHAEVAAYHVHNIAGFLLKSNDKILGHLQEESRTLPYPQKPGQRSQVRTSRPKFTLDILSDIGRGEAPGSSSSVSSKNLSSLEGKAPQDRRLEERHDEATTHR